MLEIKAKWNQIIWMHKIKREQSSAEQRVKRQNNLKPVFFGELPSSTKYNKCVKCIYVWFLIPFRCRDPWLFYFVLFVSLFALFARFTAPDELYTENRSATDSKKKQAKDKITQSHSRHHLVRNIQIDRKYLRAHTVLFSFRSLSLFLVRVVFFCIFIRLLLFLAFKINGLSLVTFTLIISWKTCDIWTWAHEPEPNDLLLP